MLAPHAEGLSGDLLALGQRSLERVPSWVAQIEADSGLPCGLRTTGIVVPFRSAEARDRYPTAAFGQPLTAEQLHRELPGLAPHWSAGLLFSQDGQIDNRRQLMRALESACVDRGVRFQEGVEVLELIEEHNRLKGVRARNSEGRLFTLACDTAVLCSGAWSSQLVPELPVFPVKGQMFSLQSPRGALRRVIFGPGTYLAPREDGLVVVGATSEREAQFREGLTPQGQTTLSEGIADLLPEASQWPPMERWWGFRPCTPDEGPLLGRSAMDGLLLASATTATAFCLQQSPLNCSATLRQRTKNPQINRIASCTTSAGIDFNQQQRMRHSFADTYHESQGDKNRTKPIVTSKTSIPATPTSRELS